MLKKQRGQTVLIEAEVQCIVEKTANEDTMFIIMIWDCMFNNI